MGIPPLHAQNLEQPYCYSSRVDEPFTHLRRYLSLYGNMMDHEPSRKALENLHLGQQALYRGRLELALTHFRAVQNSLTKNETLMYLYASDLVAEAERGH
jgi:hypothetical protein